MAAAGQSPGDIRPAGAGRCAAPDLRTGGLGRDEQLDGRRDRVAGTRQPQRQRGSLAAPAVDLQRPAGEPGALAQQAQADVPAAVRADRGRVEARALVADLVASTEVLVDPQRDEGVVDVGVLDDVEQRLLEEPVDGDRGGQRQRVRRRRPLHGDPQAVAGVHVQPQAADRRRQVALAQGRWPGARHDRADLLLGVLDVVGELGDLRVR